MKLRVLIYTLVTTAYTSAVVISLLGTTLHLSWYHPVLATFNDQEGSRTEELGSLVELAQNLHKKFISNENVSVDDHYFYGYDYYDWKTRVSHEHYESRYGSIAYGTYTRISSTGKKMTIEYTVDNHYGFQITDSRNANQILKFPVPISSDIQELPPRSTLVLGDDVNPYVLTAYNLSRKLQKLFRLEPPLKFNWGYTLKVAKLGHTRGQYENTHGYTSVGRFTKVEADGTQVIVDYTANEKGFSYSVQNTLATSPVLA